MSTLAVNAITDASGGSTCTINGATPTTANVLGRNRIINGHMLINQRGGTTTVNSTASTYGVDQWAGVGQATDGVFTMAQSSATPPAGLTNFLRATTTTADASIGATQSYALRHAIEGYNVADLGWGAVGAATITLSFWVRSSLTGTFGGSVANNGNTRFYVFSYPINSANTWEQKTITVTGDTTGTWTTDNTAGIKIFFNLGAGSTYTGAAGSWGGATLYNVTSGVNLIGTLNATFDLTGVQLEKGSVASNFEYRPYGTELILCQRYYEKSYAPNVALGTVTQTDSVQWRCQSPSNISWYPRIPVQFRVTKRATPTVNTYSTQTGASGQVYIQAPNAADKPASLYSVGVNGVSVEATSGTTGADAQYVFHWTAESEL